MVLLAADGLPHTEIADRCGTSVPTVRQWRARYQAGGIEALQDLPRPGRPRKIDEALIVARTLEPPPWQLGVTHWSSRLLARDLGISSASVIETWRKWHLQPWRRQSFSLSADPVLEAKPTDMVGLYLAPPDNAVVVSVDSNQPILSRWPELSATSLRDRIEYATLLSALDIADRQVSDACPQWEFLPFLKRVVTGCPGRDLHVICDNRVIYDHPEVRTWLATNPRVTPHAPPGDCSWLSTVEIFFAIVTGEATRPGACGAVKDLVAKIDTFINGWNECTKPFAWTMIDNCQPRDVSRNEFPLREFRHLWNSGVHLGHV